MKKEELAQFNGQNGQKAYIACKGKIYDVTDSKKWSKGIHMARHKAGEDLTDFLAIAPHTDEVLKNFTIVDTLEQEEKITENTKETLRAFYQKFHPHPVFVHYPLGLFFFAALMQFLYLITNLKSFDDSALYAFFIATIMSIPAILAGLLSWWINYDRQVTTIFRNKIFFSIFLILIGFSAIILRISNPDMLIQHNIYYVAYNILVFVNLPIVLFIAYEGGKITWA